MKPVKRCSKCRRPHTRSQRYCADCHAEYMREWRKTHPPSEEQRHKIIARAYANVYVQRGKLTRQPCEVCGGPAQIHHEDYDKPLEVRWLCRPHHLAEHRAMAATV